MNPAIPLPPRSSHLRGAVLAPEALAELGRILLAEDRALAEDHGITATQWHALQALVREGPVTVTELGLILHLEKSTASRLADALLKRRLVRKRPLRGDGRVTILQLTETGIRLSRRMLNRRTEIWMGVLAGVDPEVRVLLPSVLHRLTSALTEARGDQNRFR